MLIAKGIKNDENVPPMNNKRDLDKETLYKAVKTLVEHPNTHVHLPQQKLFTLFSIAFQYMLFWSSKNPGHYILRIEDAYLADKLAKKAKDETTRKFMQRILIPRRMTYSNSTFHLDYFNLASWGVTKDLPREKIQGAIIVKNTSHNPLIDEGDFRQVPAFEDQSTQDLFGKNYFLNSLIENVPRTVTIAYDDKFDNTTMIEFDFIEDKNDSPVGGVKLARGLELSDEEV